MKILFHYLGHLLKVFPQNFPIEKKPNNCLANGEKTENVARNSGGCWSNVCFLRIPKLQKLLASGTAFSFPESSKWVPLPKICWLVPDSKRLLKLVREARGGLGREKASPPVPGFHQPASVTLFSCCLFATSLLSESMARALDFQTNGYVTYYLINYRAIRLLVPDFDSFRISLQRRRF